MEAAEERLGLVHGRIDLARVANVKAERRFRQLVKKPSELHRRAPDTLALVHVLHAHGTTKPSPQRKVADDVWTDNDGPMPGGDRLQGVGQIAFR